MKKNCFALLIGIALSIILIEVSLRIYPFIPSGIPNKVTGHPDKILGWFNDSNQFGAWAKRCFYIKKIHTNNFGMSQPWDVKKDDFKNKIAIFGDSFMEAWQVCDYEKTVSIMQYLIDPNFKKYILMNFGVSGYGTINEYLAYKFFAKKFSPKIAILFLLPGNDIRNNLYELEKISYRPFYLLDKDEFVFPKIDLKKTTVFFKIHKFLKKHFATYNIVYDYFLKNFFINFILEKKSIFKENKLNKIINKCPFPENLKDLCVYIPPLKNSIWEKAWKVTERVILKFKEEVERDNGKFLLVILVDFAQIDGKIKERLKKRYKIEFPKNFDPEYPIKRLIKFCNKNKIPYLSLLPYFKEYKKKYKLSYPYFSYKCDGHWNPLGHFLTSNLVVKYLNDKEFLTIDREYLNLIEENLNLSPKDILGEQAYLSIFKYSFNKGNSNLCKKVKEKLKILY